MFQNDYRREMDGLRPSPAAVERLNRLLEEGNRPGGCEFHAASVAHCVHDAVQLL